jgi:hypothetical protein
LIFPTISKTAKFDQKAEGILRVKKRKEKKKEKQEHITLHNSTMDWIYDVC